MKNQKVFECTNCQFQSPKWYGKCPNCQAWNTFLEKIIEKAAPAQEKKNILRETSGNQIQTLGRILENLKDTKETKYVFSAEILDNFWGNGLVAGSLTLLAGEPGLGKSTLALQLLRSLLAKSPGLKCLYITAEESATEIARRSQRLAIPETIQILQTNNFPAVEKVILETQPEIVIMDSIQTIFSPLLAGSPGSVAQVTLITNQFLNLAKSQNISIILIGHVTKEGQIAGPKTLEHLVDSVLTLESSEIAGFRTLSFSKHRYGSVDNELLLKMENTGLEIITDPSLALLENLETGIGVCYGLAFQKNLPLVVEIQALVGKDYRQGAFGRREALGLKVSKLNTVIAIIEKYLSLDLKNMDVYLQITGLPKNTYDESLDLPILLAILSSFFAKSLSEFLDLKPNSKVIFSGRLTLSGKVRSATKETDRQKIATRLKFKYNPEITIGNLQDNNFAKNYL